MIVSIADALALLCNERIVAIPTETVYGLCANAFSDKACLEIYRIKGRPSFNPLILHVLDQQKASSFAVFDERAQKLCDHFWGTRPLTVVLPLKDNACISSVATCGKKTVAIRVPSHPIFRSVLEKLSFPLCAPSANRSSYISATTHENVMDQLDVPVIDGGRCSIGLESTIVDLSGPYVYLLRKGSVTQEEIENVLQEPILVRTSASSETPEDIIAPGMLLRHYAPRLPLRLDALFPKDGEAFVAFGPTTIHTPYQLSLCEDLHEAAQNLYRILHHIDHQSLYTGIAIMPIPRGGVGDAIHDRLERASYQSPHLYVK